MFIVWLVRAVIILIERKYLSQREMSPTSIYAIGIPNQEISIFILTGGHNGVG